MALSGSIDFTVTRDQIIYSALRLLTVIKDDEDPSKWEVDNAAQALNLMVKSWQTEGIGLWLFSFATIYLEYNKQYYNLNSSTGDHATLSSDETALGADAASGATSITVDSISGITASDYIGIELDDGTMQWTTVSGTPSGTTVNLGAALTDDASEDNVVYTYTTKMARPLSILELRSVDSSGNEIPVELVARDIFMMNTPKDMLASYPVQSYYDPQLTTGVLYVHPTASDVSCRLHATVKGTVNDFDAASNNAHFPVEWLEALKYNLAIRLAPEFSTRIKNTQMIPLVVSMARELKDQAKMFDSDNTSVRFIPDWEEW